MAYEMSIEISTILAFCCADCGDPLKAKREGDEIWVQLCTNCCDYANNEGYDRAKKEAN